MARKQGKEKELAALEVGEVSPSIPGVGRREKRCEKEQSLGVEEQVSDLFGKLNLTAKEKETLVLEDAEDSDLAVVNHAVIGKVLGPDPLQLPTIMSAICLAWGNPKGLVARMVATIFLLLNLIRCWTKIEFLMAPHGISDDNLVVGKL